MIKRVWVDRLGGAGANIYWEIGGTIPPSSILIQYARNATGDEWEDLATVDNSVWTYHDAVNRTAGTRRDIWYRLVVTYLDGSVEGSPGVDGYGGLPKKDWLIGQKIIKDTLLRMVKGAGSRGLLFKRKAWGEVCPTCADFNTGAASTPSCSACHGTGLTGGYYPGIMSWAEIGEVAKKLNLNGPGIDREVTTQARIIAVPEPEARDIWVDMGTGIRYMIGVDNNAVQVAAQLRGRPLVVVAQMTPLPESDTAYQLPTNDPKAGPQQGPYRLPDQKYVERPSPYGEY